MQCHEEAVKEVVKEAFSKFKKCGVNVSDLGFLGGTALKGVLMAEKSKH